MSLIQKIRRELFTISLFLLCPNHQLSQSNGLCVPRLSHPRVVSYLSALNWAEPYFKMTRPIHLMEPRGVTPIGPPFLLQLIDPLSNRESGNGVRLHLLCIQSRTPVMPQPLFLELTWHLRYYGSLLASESNRRVPHNAP